MSKLMEIRALVHGMTRSEKRAFTISTTHLEGNQTMKLYQCLLAHPLLAQKALTPILAAQNLMTSLPTLLMRLRKLLVKSLRAQNLAPSVDARLRFALAEIELLFQKKLLNQIPERIRKARKLARRFSRYSHELQLIDWERRMLLEQQPNQLEKTYQTLSHAEAKILEELMLQKKLVNIQVQMRSLSREVLNPKTVDEISRYNQLYEDPAIERALRSSDFLAKAYAHNTIGLYQIAMRSWQDALSTYTALMEQWKASSEWLNEQPDLFLANLNNYQISFLYAPTWDLRTPGEFTSFFSQHRFDTPKVRLRFETMTFSHKLVVHLNLGMLDEAKLLCRDIEQWLTVNKTQLPKSSWLAFQHNLAVLHFLSGDFSASNQNVRAILNYPEGEQRRDIRVFALFFQLILQKELGNEDLVEYRFRSVRRHLSQVENQEPFYIALLSYFNPQSRKSEAEKITGLKREMDGIETGFLGVQEVQMWVESKFRKKTVTEIFLSRIR